MLPTPTFDKEPKKIAVPRLQSGCRYLRLTGIVKKVYCGVKGLKNKEPSFPLSPMV